MDSISSGSTKQPVGLVSQDALPAKTDGCKARIANNGYSIVKICNTADAVFAGNPSGRGDFFVLRHRGLLVWASQTAFHRFLHYKKIIPVALVKQVRQAARQRQIGLWQDQCISSWNLKRDAPCFFAFANR